MTLNYKRPRRRQASALVGVATFSLLGSTLVVAPAQASDESRSVSVSAVEAQGLPGQYMVDQGQDGYLWVTGSSGRPPIVTSTLAKVNPETLKLEAVAQLPIARTGTGEAAGYNALGAYGVAVDDANGTVWVTNTRTNSISVFSQKDMKLLFTDYNKETGEGTIQHPREVIVDQATGKAFVGAASSIHAFDLKTFDDTVVTNPSSESGRQAKMNLALDSEGHRLFVPDLAGGIVEVYNTETLQIQQTIELKKDDETAELSASDVAFDKSLNELYVTSQGEDGKNSGVAVYDATTGDFKEFVNFGTQALSIDNDEDRDFVYVTDFSTGKVGVLDAKSHAIVSTVQAGKSGANDVEVLDDGSVVVVNKGTYAENVTVPFTLDYLSGEYKTSATETKGATAEPSAISANSIVKFTVTDNGVAVPTDTETQTVTASDGATVTGAKVVENGKAIEVTGTGWKHSDGTGSYISVKADKGTVSKDGNGAIAETEADASGNFKLTIPFPSTTNGYNADWSEGSEHTLHFLSGSGKDGDTVRSPILKVTVGATSSSDAETVTPEQLDFAGYPAATATDPDNSLVSQASYKDIKEGDMFWKDVKWVTDTDVAEGWDDDTYRPLQGIERGAMAAYLYRLAGSPRYTAPEISPFKDVSTDHEFYKEIAWLEATGITTGWEDGTFRPDQTINRDAMAAFFYRAAGSPETATPTGNVFSDVNSSTAFAKEIAWLKSQKIANGWEDGTYRPYTAINRDAMAAFVHRFAETNDVKVSAE